MEKLKDQQISTSSGSVVSADKLIGVSIDDGNRVSFYDKSGAAIRFPWTESPAVSRT